MRSTTSRIKSEIKQKKPFRSRQQEAAIAILRTADVVRRRLARVIETRGITLQQYNVLRIVGGAGSEGIPTLEIAGRMIEQTPGITRLLDRLDPVKRQLLGAGTSALGYWIPTDEDVPLRAAR